MLDHLLPTLLERLRDDNPERSQGSVGEGSLDLEGYRASVLDHLERLLNATPPPDRPGSRWDSQGGGIGQGEKELAWVGDSGRFYGLDLPLGGVFSPETVEALRKQLLLAVQRYEPRLRAIRVLAERVPNEAVSGGKAVGATPTTVGVPAFVIEAELYAEPVPEELRIRAEVDLVSGLTRIASVTTGQAVAEVHGRTR